MARFRRAFSNPLLIAREPGALDSEIRKGENTQRALNQITSRYILRRTNDLNKKHLPDKLTMTVMVRLSHLQKTLYRHLTERARTAQAESAQLRQAGIESPFSTFAAISALRKLVNHPALLARTMQQNMAKDGNVGFFLDGLGDLMPSIFTASLQQGGRRDRQVGRRSSGGGGSGDDDMYSPEFAGKMMLAANMMKGMLNMSKRATSMAARERIVIVSNFTETLDVFARLISSLGAKFVRLDGSIAVSKRQRIVDQFNDASQGVFAFLLSSKAGGCGINLIGGNRLILFDPSWNPADDRQAAARIWRDGQKKRCYVYRFLSTGTIDEQIFARQVTKEGLADLVMDDEIAGEAAIAQADVSKLFNFYEDTPSSVHDFLNCKGCKAREKFWKLHPRNAGFKPEADQGVSETDINSWAHHSSVQSVDDELLKHCGGDEVTYVFSLTVKGEKN
jgi:DNA repair and recombination RAD54-like protein